MKIQWLSSALFRGAAFGLITALTLLWAPGRLMALDTVSFIKPHYSNDHRLNYSIDLLKTALANTEAEHGPWALTLVPVNMNRSRQISELLLPDGAINTIISPPKPQYNAAIRIQYPVYRGLASFRLYLVEAENLHIFKAAKNLTPLLQATTGVGAQWSLTGLLRNNGFNLVEGTDYEALFKMLNSGRFQVFPRGLNEVFDELLEYRQHYPALTLEPHVALYTYLPIYLYVSPHQKMLAARIEQGIHRGLKDGSLDRLFHQYFGESLKKANLRARKIFFLENTQISQNTFAQDQPFLIHTPQKAQ